MYELLPVFFFFIPCKLAVIPAVLTVGLQLLISAINSLSSRPISGGEFCSCYMGTHKSYMKHEFVTKFTTARLKDGRGQGEIKRKINLKSF